MSSLYDRYKKDMDHAPTAGPLMRPEYDPNLFAVVDLCFHCSGTLEEHEDGCPVRDAEVAEGCP